MKGLIVLFGESFRSGKQQSRVRGKDESFVSQIKGSKSQLEFIEHIENKYNCEVHVSINSYTTKFDNDLCNVFGERVKYRTFYDKVIGMKNIMIEPCKSINLNI